MSQDEDAATWCHLAAVCYRWTGYVLAGYVPGDDDLYTWTDWCEIETSEGGRLVKKSKGTIKYKVQRDNLNIFWSRPDCPSKRATNDFHNPSSPTIMFSKNISLSIMSSHPPGLFTTHGSISVRILEVPGSISGAFWQRRGDCK